MSAAIGNKYALGNKGGRPPHYETKELLMDEVNAYFTHCQETKEKATITGLTLYLGFSSRASLDDYCNKSEEFSYILKRAKLAVENSYEQSAGTFDIFALKNMGWADRTEIKHEVSTGFLNVDPLDDQTNDRSQEDSKPKEA